MRTKRLLAGGAAFAACTAAFFLGASSNASATTGYHHLMVKTNGNTASIRFQGYAAGTGQAENWCVNQASWGFTPWVNGWVDGKVDMVDFKPLTVTAWSGRNCDGQEQGLNQSTVPGPNGLTNDWVDVSSIPG